ncbi:MAG: hypothetical protein U0794_04505 [Isosphaeraceae bacterium]
MIETSALASPTTRLNAPRATASADGQKTVRDSLAVAVAGQFERVIGILTALILRWGLDPSSMGVYSGLRLYLDNTNRTSLGIGLGAVQEIPVLLAAGRREEAQRIAQIAYTTNTLTCLAYSALLAGWGFLAWASGPGDILTTQWNLGLIAVAALAQIKRYETFLVAVLRSYREFALTAELDVFESLASTLAFGLGIWLAGFWGLLASVAVILVGKIVYAHARHPFRFHYEWNGPIAWRLMRVGIPILANTAVFGAVQQLDRALIFWRLPDPAWAAGLYSVALLGTSWSLDLAGRLVLVSYASFQTTLGRTGSLTQVAHQAIRATEAQAPLLLGISAGAYVLAPAALGWVLPRYAEGLPALRPLLPGMVFLALAWPTRQLLIALGRPYRLCVATGAGLLVALLAGLIGADRWGIVGIAWGMSVGYAAVFLATSGSALLPILGPACWLAHLARLSGWLVLFATAALAASHVPLVGLTGLGEFVARGLVIAACVVGVLLVWAARHGWGGLFENRHSPV